MSNEESASQGMKYETRQVKAVFSEKEKMRAKYHSPNLVDR